MAENEATHVCAQCAKVFLHKRNLRTHERRHSGTLPFTCCGKGFASRRELEGHRCSAHGEAKTFICKTCGKGFTRARSLAIHEAREARNLNFSCDVCGYKTATRDSLRIHLLKHSDERRYSCNICGNNYKHSSSMYKHMKKAHNSEA